MWKTKKCGCVKANLPRAGKVVIRCPRHLAKSVKTKRLVAHFEDGMVRRG